MCGAGEEAAGPTWRLRHRFHVLLLLLLVAIPHASAQSQPQPTQDPNMSVSFRPSIAIVIGIFSIMFSLTFLLLMYAKFCHAAGSPAGLYGAPPGFLHDDLEVADTTAAGTGSRFSGIDKTVIESLPFFRFSTLRGSRDGLECAVCLSRFEGAEILRLLPRCKHAFHIDCVDRWLEAHSSCPLCRCRVRIEDVTLFKYSTSSRFLFRNANGNNPDEDLEMQLELYVEREPDVEEGYNGGDSDDQHRKDAGSSSSLRFSSIGESFRKHLDALKLGIAGGGGPKKAKTATHKDDRPPLLADKAQGQDPRGLQQAYESQPPQRIMHKFRHRIIVSDVVFKNRWSDLNSADLTSLNSEMLSAVASGRFNPPPQALVEPAKGVKGTEVDIRNIIGSTKRATAADVLSIKEEMERKRTLNSKAGEMIGTAGAGTVAGSSSRPVEPMSDANPGNRAIIRSPLIITEKQKCMSEITDMPRRALPITGGGYGGNYATHAATAGAGTSKEEKVRRMWIPIARRTVQWLAGR